MEKLENFKQKLIRMVSRLHLGRLLPYEEVWEILNKQTGRDCATLWERMRSVTLKKLSRLLAADDRRCKVSPGARMTSTDWLLFDLVLVHEGPDVIGTINNAKGDGSGKAEAEAEVEVEVAAHRRLFELVVKHEIEACLPYTCMRRWEILTKQYNVEGRECSPMLLQLRWYQLKDRARHFFYQFWSAFRGNKTNLQKEVVPPSRPLDIDVARRYPAVVTDVFPTWIELVQKKLVVLPDKFSLFAKKMKQARPIYRANILVTRASLKPQPANDAEPDIVLVEPQIDTITLDDSDTESTENHPSTSTDQQEINTEQANNQELQNAELGSAVAGILGSLEEDGLSNVQILEASHVPTEEIDDDTPLEQLQEETESYANQTGTEKVADTNETQIVSKVERNISEPAELPSTESPDIPVLVDEVLREKLNTIKAVTDERVKAESPDLFDIADEISEPAELPSTVSPDTPVLVDGELREKVNTVKIVTDERDEAESPDLPDIADEILKETLNAIKEHTLETVVRDIDSDENDTLFTSVVMPEPKVQDLVSKIKEEVTENTKEVQNEDSSTLVIGELPSNLEFIDDGIDYVEDSGDDGAEDHPRTGEPVTPASIKTEVNHEAEEIVRQAEDKEEKSKFDLKLMMLPVVYTMKIDYMKCLKQSGYETIKTTGIIDTIIEESKPISALSVEIKHEKEFETASEVAPDINTSSDLIQLSQPTEGNYPVVHEKNDSEDLIKLAAIDLKKDIDILIKSELKKETESATMEAECESDSSDESIPQSKRVKLTSGLFRKPRGRTYNPIQLCKNPDFNTRLRRISAGFLSYERNRRYLNRLKPLTIDLHKSFESYLIDKTVYLVPDPNAPKPVYNIQNNSVTTSVLPTALPVQCLLNDTPNIIRRSEVVGPIDEELAHRKNKVIELPDIEKVRRINQYLLTAEVSPLQVRNEPVTPFQEISTIQKYNSSATVPKITQEPRSDSQSTQVAHESPLHDNHPLLEVPKEGEITTVKVELCDDNDEEENLQQSDEIVSPPPNTTFAPPPQNITIAPPPQNTTIAPPPQNITIAPPPQNTTIAPPPQNITIAPPPISVQNTISAPLLQDTQTVQDTRKVAPVQPAQDTSRVPLGQDAVRNQAAVTPASAKSAAGKKEARKPLREPAKRPWYLPNTPTVGSRLEAKVPRDPSKTPWYKQNPFRSIGTSLLTKDSLQRMMLIIDGKDDCEGKKKKKKNTSGNELLSGTCIDLSTNDEVPATEEENKNESADSKKPEESLTQTKCKTRVQNINKLTFCCWANRVAAIADRKQKGRGRQNNWLPKHKCEMGKCVCCCKDVLEKESNNLKLDQWLYPNGPEPCCWARKMMTIFHERKKYESLRWMPLHNCLQGESKECKCCCKQALDAVAGLVERICKRVKDSDDIKETTKAVQGIKKTITKSMVVRSEPATSVVNDGTVAYENILTNYLGLASKGTDAALNDELSILNSSDKSIEVDSNSNESTCDRVRCRTSVQEKPQAGFAEKRCSYMVRVTKFQKLNCASYSTQSVGTSTDSDKLIELSDDEADSAPINHAEQGQKDNLKPKVHIIMTPGKKPVVRSVPPKIKKTVIAPKPKFIIKCFKHLIRTCPVRLGPDKILLTTCILPADLIMPQSNVSTTSTLSPALQPSGLMTNVQLPQGVHLVLDPNGQLACAFEPNANLDEKSILALKNVVSVIQEQLNKKNALSAQINNPVGVAPAVKDVVTLLSDDEKTDDKPANTETSEVQTTTQPSELCNEAEQENFTNTETCSSVPAPIDTAEMNVVSQDSECTSQIEVAQDSVNEGEQVVADDVTHPETLIEANEEIFANTSENIAEIQQMEAESTSSNIDAIEYNKPNEQCLSPGENSRHSECQVESLAGHISSEEIHASDVNVQPPNNVTSTETATPENDIAPTGVDESNEVAQEKSQEERETPRPMSNKKSILSDLMEMSGISSEDILAPEPPEPPLAMPMPMPEPPVATLAPVVVTAGPAEDGPIELTQVTNVAALKYAVAHNAKFYRYTLGTGALAAIEVALQSRQNQPTPVKQLIDLTDASVDDTPAPLAAPMQTARTDQAPIVGRKVVVSRPPPTITITPPTTSYGPRSLLKRPVSTISIEPKEQPLRRRKQLLDTTIYNLDATDGEMEEEYLLDSEQEDDPGKTISKLKTLLAEARAKRSAKAAEFDPDVSSDDEPLAKKAKRRRRAKKLKKKFKAAKKQLKLIQKAAGTYSIMPECAPASENDAVNYSIVPMETEAPEAAVAVAATTDELRAESATFTKTTDALPVKDIPDSVAEELANEGELWLEPSEDESDNFILGA